MKKEIRRIFNAAIKRGLPAGDGHPVLVLPGILEHDLYTVSLRKCIKTMGYKVYGWENGINTGISEKSLGHLRDHLQKIFTDNGGQKITLIGHSLGGIVARELAREFPEMVRDVITIGTPFGGFGKGKNDVPPHLLALHKYLNPDTAYLITDEDMVKRLLTPPPVPTTSIFSKGDRVVAWKACLNPDTPQSENIEIHTNHLAHLTMLFSPAVAVILMDRLAGKEGAWKPFNTQGYESLTYPHTLKEKDIPADPGWTGKMKPLFKKPPRP